MTRAPSAGFRKRVSEREWRAHEFVARVAPELVPRVLAATPDSTETPAYVLELEDLAQTGYAPLATPDATGPDATGADTTGADTTGATPAADAYREVARAAAKVHVVAARHRDALAALNLPRRTAPVDEVLAAAERLPSMADLAGTAPGVAIPEALLATLPAVAGQLRAAMPPPPTQPTLVHGDLHTGNVMRRADGELRLVDWGEACLAPPAWDLVFFDEAGIAAYLEARAALGAPVEDRNGFFARLRWMTVRRAASLLDAATVAAFGGTPGAGGAVAVCLDRIVQAANASVFRGGRLHVPASPPA